MNNSLGSIGCPSAWGSVFLLRISERLGKENRKTKKLLRPEDLKLMWVEPSRCKDCAEHIYVFPALLRVSEASHPPRCWSLGSGCLPAPVLIICFSLTMSS